MNEEEENNIQFIEPGEDTAKTLEAVKQALYLISFLVYLFVIFPFGQTIAFWGHNLNHLQSRNLLLCFIAFIGFIHNHKSPFPTRFFKCFQQYLPSGASPAVPGDKEKSIKDTIFGTTVCMSINSVPIPESLRQPTPFAALLSNIQNGIEYLQI